jgi:hypothetical protein
MEYSEESKEDGKEADKGLLHTIQEAIGITSGKKKNEKIS